MTTLVQGDAIAQEVGDKIAGAIKQMIKKPVMGIVIVSENPVTQSYVTRKRMYAQVLEIPFEEKYLKENITQVELEKEVVEFATRVDGLVVQLPLPKHIDTGAILQLIPQNKDVDALHPGGANEGVVSPVASAVLHVLREHEIQVEGANCVVIGRGQLVGAPVAQELVRLGGAVSMADKDTAKEDLLQMLQTADIVVSGAGVASLITEDMITEGCVLIDAGTSTSSGTLAGDIDPNCYDKARLVSPTPGGVGPITVAKLFENLIVLFTLDD